MARCERSAERTSRWLVFALFSMLSAVSFAAAQVPDDGVTTMQDDPDPDRILTYEQSTLYMYGENSGQSYTEWDTWNHAEENDGQSANSFFEDNIPGSGNSGGGMREFIFDGTDASDNDTGIDSEQPIAGTLTLAINCSGCSKEVTLALRIGAINGLTDITTITLPGPDDADGDVYTFAFEGHRIEKLDAGEVFGLRIQFTKPSGFTDSYTLYLGRDNFEMTIPVLPPYEEEVPGLELNEGEQYISPYAQGSSGFAEEQAEQSGWAGPILMLFLTAGFTGLIIKLMPPTGVTKVLAVTLVLLGMLASLTVIPIISGPVAMMTAVDENDPDVWTIDEIAALPEVEGTFLGELSAGTEMKVYIPYEVVYRARDTDEGGWHFGLGFEDAAEALSDATESTPRGREYVQLYFSMTGVDLTPGSAVILNVRLVNTSTSDGGYRVVPQWAVPNEEGNQFWVKDEVIGGRWVIPEYDANGDAIVELVGVSYTWQYHPLIGSLIGLLIGAAGVYLWVRARQTRRSRVVDDYDEDDEYDFDDDEDLDFDEDFDDDDFDFDDDL